MYDDEAYLGGIVRLSIVASKCAQCDTRRRLKTFPQETLPHAVTLTDQRTSAGRATGSPKRVLGSTTELLIGGFIIQRLRYRVQLVQWHGPWVRLASIARWVLTVACNTYKRDEDPIERHNYKARIVIGCAF